ncbi:MAG: RNB domain-containing ribonuclease [Burkholderiaceae bacterium]
MNKQYGRADLARIAAKDMVDRGLTAEFSTASFSQLETFDKPSQESAPDIRNLSSLLWCSIDNEESRDLDQLSVCDVLPNGAVKILVAIADVDTLVKKGSPIDDCAQQNTTSVYTAARIFPMLPERLSTDLTSLNPHVDRLAMVTEMVFDAEAKIVSSTIYRAKVHNQSKLAYDDVAAWLDGKGDMPAGVRAIAGMDKQIRTQDAVSQKLRKRRFEQGALEFRTIQSRTVFSGDHVVDVEQQQPNRARQLIEELMLATNGVTARFLASKGYSALCRVVRSPERWLKIVEVAKDLGEILPVEPDSKALEVFLRKRHLADPLRFPDLSLVVVKLMGAGEYAVQLAGAIPVGHFGLAVREYSHATAPNRRFADLITQRILKAAILGASAPYSYTELEALAKHCNEQGSDANKVERQVRKSEAALVLQSRIGEVFDGIVTSASSKGVWVRVFHPPVDGRLSGPGAAPRIGQKVKAKLTLADVERGFIDFEEVK